MFSKTGTTRSPELTLSGEGGTFATSRGSASLAGAYGRFDYNVFGNQFNTSGSGPNDDYSNSLEGTNLGGLMGLPPSGKHFRVPAVFLYELRGNKIIRERRIFDFTGMLVQIGVLKARPA